MEAVWPSWRLSGRQTWHQLCGYQPRKGIQERRTQNEGSEMEAREMDWKEEWNEKRHTETTNEMERREMDWKEEWNEKRHTENMCEMERREMDLKEWNEKRHTETTNEMERREMDWKEEWNEKQHTETTNEMERREMDWKEEWNEKRHTENTSEMERREMDWKEEWNEKGYTETTDSEDGLTYGDYPRGICPACGRGATEPVPRDLSADQEEMPMSIPPGKTPISYLQELCTKRGVTPQYDLIANEGAIHEPTFLMRVTVGDTIATGKGSSKKKAKHAAAQNALNQLLGIQNGAGDSEDNAQSINGDDGNAEGNPVGELQEFTQKKLIKPPVYEFTSEQGPPHAREFVCTVKLGKFVQKASGRSKKAAKRAAAQAMLQHIKGLSTQEGEKAAQVEDSEEEEEIPLGFEPKSSYTKLKEGKKKPPAPTPEQALEIQRFYEKVVASQGKRGQSTGDETTSTATNYCKMLQEIAEIQRFEVSYCDIKETSTNGFRQCLVQLTTSPMAVCHGCGDTTDEAHANAAHNALQYLKIVTKT